MATKVGPMVATLVKARGKTVSEVAEDVKIHRNRLADKIAGRRQFTEAEILTLAAYFDVEPGQLFRDPLQLLGVSRESSETRAWVTGVDRHLKVAA